MLQRILFRQGQVARAFSTAPSAIRRPSQQLLQPQFSQMARPLTIRQPAVRCYSTEKEASNGENNKDAEATEGESEPDPVRKELEEKKKEAAEMKDKYVRSVADFLNLQERTKRDMDNARNFAIRKFAVDLLESIDNFDRALLAVPEDKLSSAAAEQNKDLQELVTGLRMTQNVLMNSLKKHGVERFDPSDRTEDGKAQKFDPNLHEATFMAKAEGMDDGDVMYTQSKGFTLNGVVLRVS